MAEAAITALNKLPRGCLPDKTKEWTVFSAICEENSEFRIVSAGTGTKCLSKGQLSTNGTLLNDSHAEVIAIRAFKRYLMCELEKFMRSSESAIFEGSLAGGYQIKPTVKYHFFTTHPPCGDATIFPVDSESNAEEPPSKKVKVVDDCSFTGAKMIAQSDTGDALAQNVGAVRIKPGRGERTLSMSCSDKLAKVLVLGVQGSLLSSLLNKRIYLKSILLSKNSAYHKESMERALYKRFPQKDFPIPELLESSVDFPYPKDDNKLPCPKTIIWCCVADKPLEISVDGRRQGVSKKNISHTSSRLKVCRIEMFRQFMSLLKLKYPNKEKELETQSYAEVKSKYCKEYLSAWEVLKRDYFKQWSVKPTHLQDFRLEEQ